VLPLLAVFAFGDAQIHVYPMNCSNIATNIETPVNEAFSLFSTLSIPDINLDDYYIQFGQCFDDTRLQHKINIIIEDVSSLNNFLYYTRCNGDVSVIYNSKPSELD